MSQQHTSSARTVLLNIARCPLTAPGASCGTPCAAIVASQASQGERFHVPEPWRGDLAGAPLLFVSSNPSWQADDDCPTASSSDDTIAAYFTKGFPDTFLKVRLADGRPGRSVAFWSAIRRRAAELYDRDAEAIVAGQDFALTEVVHCKSTGETGVAEAATACADRHLAAVMRLSPARVVVLLGKVARARFGAAEVGVPALRDLYGKRRLVVSLPHPNAREPRTFAGRCTPADLNRLRAALR
jgi:hypothetical protein